MLVALQGQDDDHIVGPEEIGLLQCSSASARMLFFMPFRTVHVFPE